MASLVPTTEKQGAQNKAGGGQDPGRTRKTTKMKGFPDPVTLA